MNSYDDDTMNSLLASYLGKAEESYVGMQKTYTLRLPIESYACVEVLASKNNLSRNDIIANFVKLGMTAFLECLEEVNPISACNLDAEIAELMANEIKRVAERENHD